ncbi:hypothetical protein DID75_00595 [Candidatus Marinamargulisbacteria bacterium SCGC AG-410-N11]|nr:hypothetical protein DID75_00595 [Candidatus Marinamargulisbacteria bacterium SCGC AG-410-N11]
MGNYIDLENKVSLSNSCIWKLQQDYFKKLGKSAWEGQVPFYVTSNTKFSFSIANIVFNYLLELISKNKVNIDEPLYILEFGSGLAKFGFHFMTKLAELKDTHNLSHIQTPYILTDLPEENMRFWESNKQLKPFLDNKQCDFAKINIENFSNIETVKHNFIIDNNTIKNPLIVLCNYLIDSVPHDCFKISNNQINEVLVSTQIKEDYKNKTIDHLNQLKFEFSFKEINNDHYEDPILNDILNNYKETIYDSHILIPTSGIKILKTILNKFSKNTLLVVSDKGWSNKKFIDQQGEPHIAFHGSFSLMVNFDTLKQYTESIGGSSVITSTGLSGLKTGLFHLSENLNLFSKTITSFNSYLNATTDDFLTIKNSMLANIDSLSANVILSLLKYSEWDEKIFSSVSKRLEKVLPNEPMNIKLEFINYLPNIEKNIFEVNLNNSITYLDLGNIYYSLAEYKKAKEMFNYYNERNSTDWASFHNLGLALFYLREYDQAMSTFKTALNLKADSEISQEWVDYIKTEYLEVNSK